MRKILHIFSISVAVIFSAIVLEDTISLAFHHHEHTTHVEFSRTTGQNIEHQHQHCHHPNFIAQEFFPVFCQVANTPVFQAENAYALLQEFTTVQFHCYLLRAPPVA